jgi:hypothetical protein
MVMIFWDLWPELYGLISFSLLRCNLVKPVFGGILSAGAFGTYSSANEGRALLTPHTGIATIRVTQHKYTFYGN